MKTFTVYILKCNDGSFYTGMTSNLEKRLAQHHSGFYPTCYTFKRRPLELVYHTEVQRFEDAVALEKQIKGWSRNKKIALIEGRFEDLSILSRNYTQYGKPDTSSSPE